MMSRQPRRTTSWRTSKPKDLSELFAPPPPQELTVYHDGKNYTMAEFAALAGTDTVTIRRRLIKFGWSAYRALTNG